MKKVITISVILIILFATLTGCWGNSASSIGIIPNNNAPTEIGIIPDNINVPDVVLDTAVDFVKRNFRGVEFDNWRLDYVEHVYSYDSMGIEVYRFQWRVHTTTPDKIMLVGGMDLDAGGWLLDTYPNSHYLLFNNMGNGPEFLFSIFANDCYPGDEIFTQDVLNRLGIFIENEMYDFPLLRADWTKGQIEELGLHKEVRDGTTYYFDETIRYIILDWYSSTTPDIIEVYGQYEGPRGIRVGDSFDKVINLFPIVKDWETSEFGEFYGKIYETEHWEPYGNVAVVSDVEKNLTVTPTGHAPWFRVFFTDDVVTHYTFYLTSAM